MLDAFEQAISIDPNFANAFHGKGKAFRYLMRSEEAIAAFDKALQLNPEYLWAWRFKGDILRDLGRDEEALVAFQQALNLEPVYAIDWYNLADLAWASCRKALDKAKELGFFQEEDAKLTTFLDTAMSMIHKNKWQMPL